MALRFVLLAPPAVLATLLPPGDPNIMYVGRTCSSQDGAARLLDWAGVQAIVRFSGSSLAALLAGSSIGDRFLAVIDGEISDRFLVSHGDMQRYTLADGLQNTEHTAELWKISEHSVDPKHPGGATEFGGFFLPSGGLFLSPASPKARRLEFWGDSMVAGWCTDGSPQGSDTPQAPVHNTYESWAAQMARDLDADFVAEAISGIGVTDHSVEGAMHRYVDGACISSGADWDYNAWSPDALVFWLGLNDEDPGSKGFRSEYLSLMEHAASKYAHADPKPKLVHVCGSDEDGSVDPCGSIQEAIHEFNAERSDGFESFYAPIDVKTWKSVGNNPAYHGCDDHYNPAGHELVKSSLLPRVRSILGWSDSWSDIVV